MALTAAQEMAISTGQNFVWHELYTNKMGDALKFYQEALGFGTEEMDMGPGGKYQMLTRNGKAICGLQDTSTAEMQGVPTHWAVYLSVDDLDARIEKCKEHGATVLVGPMSVPTVGRMALIQDPTGATIWLFKGEM